MNGDNKTGRERMAQANQCSVVLLEARAREFMVVASIARRETEFPQLTQVSRGRGGNSPLVTILRPEAGTNYACAG